MLEELSVFPHWLCHNGDKIPRRIKDKDLASPTNPDDWSSWEDACAFMQKHANAGWGLGFVITKDTGITCIDLDRKKALSVEVDNFQTGIFNTFTNTYAEYSVSGKGCHIWVKGTYTGEDGKYGIRNDAYETEVYSHARYMAMSFNPIPGRNLAITGYQKELDALTGSLRAKSDALATPRSVTLAEHDKREVTLSDVQIHNAVMQSNYGERWRHLIIGNYEAAGYRSWSDADQAFFSTLANFGATPKQAKNMFFSCALSNRDKAKRRGDYIDRTLLKAYGDKVVNVHSIEPTFDTDDESEDSGVTVPKVSWSKPPGLLGDVIEYIYNSSILPNMEISISAGIAFLSAITARAYNTATGIGLNQYFVLVGKSGIGKEAAHKGISSLINALRRDMGNPFAELFVGPSIAASSTGLLRTMSESPYSKLIVAGEIGHLFQTLNGKYANDNSIQLKKTLLDIYNKSGNGGSFNGSRYASSKDNIPIIDSPALTIFGESTPDEFFKSLDDGSIADGFVSRLTTIHCPSSSDSDEYNHNAAYVKPSDALLLQLNDLVTHCAQVAAAKPHFTVVGETPEANKFSEEYRKRCRKLMNEDQKNGAHNLWYRAHLRMIKLGAVIAIGCGDINNPVVEVEHYQWAAKLIDEGVSNMLARFVSGNVGEVSANFEQRQIVEDVLLKVLHINGEAAYKKNLSMLNMLGLDRILVEKKIIKKGLLNRYIKGYNVFKKDRNLNMALVGLWRMLEEDDIVEEVPFEDLILLVGKQAKRGQYYKIKKFRGSPKHPRKVAQ